MQTNTFTNKTLTIAGLLLTFPAAIFIAAGILSGFGLNGLTETIQPVAERWGIKESPGWNISSVILFGPLLALPLTLFQVLKIEGHFTKGEFLFSFSIQKKWFPLLVSVFSGGLLTLLFIYLVGENCNCF